MCSNYTPIFMTKIHDFSTNYSYNDVKYIINIIFITDFYHEIDGFSPFCSFISNSNKSWRDKTTCMFTYA